MKIEKVTRNFNSLVKRLLKRGEDSYDEVDSIVKQIIEDVKTLGDLSILKYTKQFDGVELDHLRVTKQEIEESYQSIAPEFLQILEKAKKNIMDYHLLQTEKSWYINKGDGVLLGQQITPLERVGVYVPGGKAAYPSTVLMDVIPAKVAGVKEIVVVTPPDEAGKVNPKVLAACKVLGVNEIYKVGGAQAIAALAGGTETIRPVVKIVGPGNIYVARAKKHVYGLVDIDMIAGPSEICVIADQFADPSLLAADLLSQAEHDELAAAILITNSMKIAEAVKEEINSQLQSLERYEIAKQSILSNGMIFVTEDIQQAIELANEIAPEHLELMVEDAFSWILQVKNAGAIFLGKYSPEPIGDYWAGPNHTLPTNGTAKFSSPLGTYDFVKRSSVISYSESAFHNVADDVIQFANEEGLTAHANSIRARINK